MQRAALLFPIVLCASPALVSAQELPCDHLEDPSWIEWSEGAGVKSDGRLVSLNLDGSGSADLVLLPATSSASIPHVMLDVDRWRRGGALNEGETFSDIASFRNFNGRDALLSAGLGGVANWVLSPQGDHFTRSDLGGPWTKATALESYTKKGSVWGILAVCDGNADSIYLQSRLTSSIDTYMDLGSMLAPSSISDFALIDFLAGDGLPELVVLDSRGLSVFDLTGTQVLPSIPLAADQLGHAHLTAFDRVGQMGQDIYWVSRHPGEQRLNFLGASGATSQLGLLGLNVDSLQIEDLDENGVPDLVLFDESFGLFMMINNPKILDGSFMDRDLVLFSSELGSTPIALADLDHDGDLDLVADAKLYQGSLVDPSAELAVVDPDSFSFGLDKSGGPQLGGTLPTPISTALPAAPIIKRLPQGGRSQAADAEASANSSASKFALQAKVDRIRFRLLNMERLPADANELMIDVHVELEGSAGQLQDLPVASISLPIASEIELDLSPHEDVLYHYFSIRPRRVITGQPTWSYPTISFRWRPMDGADANYSLPKPPMVCDSEELRLGRSGPVPVIPVTFLGSWPSYY